MQEDFLNIKLEERKAQQSYRQLKLPEGKIDFCSNDYLGMVRNNLIPHPPGQYRYGSTGSRLLAGNYRLIEETEHFLANFHQAESALIFNSGYDANLGLLSSVPQRGDTIFYDYLSHASIRDGIRLSRAQSFSFRHNDINDLEKKLKDNSLQGTGNTFVVTESVFSMDGDCLPLKDFVDVCIANKALLIIDEAHATGVVGQKGEGLVQDLQLQQHCFARVHTFGKAVGCHGAVVLGSDILRNFLINFSRPFVYTTALPEASIAAVRAAYETFPNLDKERKHLKTLVQQFQSARLSHKVLPASTPIQVVVIPGNEQVKKMAALSQLNNLDVRAILYPTVPKGSERLRIVLHAFNTTGELEGLIRLLS